MIIPFTSHGFFEDHLENAATEYLERLIVEESEGAPSTTSTGGSPADKHREEEMMWKWSKEEKEKE